MKRARIIPLSSRKQIAKDQRVFNESMILGTIFGDESQLRELYHRLEDAVPFSTQDFFTGVDELTARRISRVGSVARSQLRKGRPRRSSLLLQELLRRTEESLGEGHLQTAPILMQLASSYEAEGKTLQAEALFVQALWVIESNCGPLHELATACLIRLAEFHQRRGAHTKAEAVFQFAALIFDRLCSDEVCSLERCASFIAEYAQCLRGMAIFYVRKGRYRRAKEVTKKALEAYQVGFGHSHADTGIALASHGAVLHALGEYDAAADYLERAAAICEGTIGCSSWILADILDLLVDVYKCQENTSGAWAVQCRSRKFRAAIARSGKKGAEAA